MNLVAIAHVLALLTVANGSPVVAKRIFGARFSQPLDGGALFVDNRALLGRSKTIRGLIASLVFTVLAARLTGLAWTTGAIFSAAAMAGDLLSSFVKRRMGKPSSAMALGLDQIPESLLPALFASRVFALTTVDVVAITVLFFCGQLLVSRILYAIKLRDEPY